jgi:hypothetical protein
VERIFGHSIGQALKRVGEHEANVSTTARRMEPPAHRASRNHLNRFGKRRPRAIAFGFSSKKRESRVTDARRMSEDVNLNGSFHTTSAAVPAMVNQRFGASGFYSLAARSLDQMRSGCPSAGSYGLPASHTFLRNPNIGK